MKKILTESGWKEVVEAVEDAYHGEVTKPQHLEAFKQAAKKHPGARPKHMFVGQHPDHNILFVSHRNMTHTYKMDRTGNISPDGKPIRHSYDHDGNVTIGESTCSVTSEDITESVQSRLQRSNHMKTILTESGWKPVNESAPSDAHGGFTTSPTSKITKGVEDEDVPYGSWDWSKQHHKVFHNGKHVANAETYSDSEMGHSITLYKPDDHKHEHPVEHLERDYNAANDRSTGRHHDALDHPAHSISKWFHPASHPRRHGEPGWGVDSKRAKASRKRFGIPD